MTAEELNQYTKKELISMITKLKTEDILDENKRHRMVEPSFNGKPLAINKMGLLEYSDWRIRLYKAEFKVEPDIRRKEEYTRLTKIEIEKYISVYDELLKKEGIDKIQKIYIELNTKYTNEIQNL